MRQREADTLLRFVRVARPAATTAVTVTDEPTGDRQAQADRLVRHWRNELVPLAALPGVGGRFAQPIREVVAGTVQGLLVLSLAQLCAVTDEREQAALVARLVLRDEPPPGWSPRATAGPPPRAARLDPFAKRDPAAKRDIFAVPIPSPADEVTEPAQPGEADPGPAGARSRSTVPAQATDPDAAEPLEDPADLGDSPEEAQTWKLVAQRTPATIVSAARELWTIHRLAGQRAEGRLWHRALSSLPAVGLVGAALGERHALADIAAAAYAELGLAPPEPGPSAVSRATAAATSTARSTAKGVAAFLPPLSDLRQRSPFRHP